MAKLICKVDGVVAPGGICSKVKVSATSPAPCGSEFACEHQVFEPCKSCGGEVGYATEFTEPECLECGDVQ